MARPIEMGYSGRAGRPAGPGGPLDALAFLGSAPDARPIPVVYGTAWVEGFPLYVDNVAGGWGVEFKDTLSGPALNGCSPGTQARVQVGFCQGPITSIDYVRRDKVMFHAGADGGGRFNFKYLSAADTVGGTGFSYAPTFTLGDVATASVWAPLAGEASAYRRLGYGHLAVMRCEKLMLPGGKMPSLWARVRGKCATYADPGILAESTAAGAAQTVYGALPGDILKDLLTSAVWGAGEPSGSIVTDVGADGNAASSFDRYCLARGFFLSLVLDGRQSIVDVIKMVLAATDSTMCVSGGSWKVIPYGDSVVTRAGYTYTPPSVSIGLVDDDLVGDGVDRDVVELDQVAEEDTRNCYPIEYVPGYGWGEDSAPTESMEVASVAITGLRRADPISLPCIRSAAHAQVISALMAQRSVANRTTARLTVNWRHPEIEPADLLSVSHAQLGLSAKLFRVVSTEEKGEGGTEIEAVEWNLGVSVCPVYNPQTADGLLLSPMSGADPALGVLLGIAADSVFSASEHAAALTAWLDLNNASGDLVAKANALGVVSTFWTDALQALGTYLNGGATYTSGLPSWLVAPFVDVGITASEWRTKWDTAYLERNKLLAAVGSAIRVVVAPTNVSAVGTSASQTPLWCPPVTVIPSGGAGGYSYSWAKVSGSTVGLTGANPAVFSLNTPGNSTYTAVYRVTVTDANGATGTADVSVSFSNYGSAAPVVATGSPLSLYGQGDGRMPRHVYSDYVMINATGGTGSYSYSWALVSGDTLSVDTSLGGNYVRFHKTSLAVDASVAATYRCTITDGGSGSATVDVAVELFNPAA